MMNEVVARLVAEKTTDLIPVMNVFMGVVIGLLLIAAVGSVTGLDGKNTLKLIINKEKK